MNLLAHAYLSFDQPEILVGNMISDHVKGKKQFDYSPAIHKGILLHRKIDEFTDSHPTTTKLKSFFKDDYGLYAGALGDVVYDYFLANDINQFATDKSLSDFSINVYATLDNYFDELPPNFQKMVPYMKKENWLYNYKFPEGIKNSFAGLTRRAKYLTDSAKAFEIFNQHQQDIQICYDEFFPQLKRYAAEQLEQFKK